MLDSHMRRFIDPPLDATGRILAARGVGANAVTLLGGALGLLAAAAIIPGWFWLALVLMLASRLADGLDGAIARATRKTDFGGYLDITIDFLFYGAIPLGFVLHDPGANGAVGALLLASFYFNGATFLAYAILAEKKGLETAQQGSKSLYYSTGLLEGTETILFFVLILLFPGSFVALGTIFALLCFVTGGLRILLARQVYQG